MTKGGGSCKLKGSGVVSDLVSSLTLISFVSD